MRRLMGLDAKLAQYRDGAAFVRAVRKQAGWRALDPVFAELLREGSPFVGTATQNPAEMVRQAVQVAQDIIAGQPPAETTILIPSELITRDNVAEYPGW